MSLEKTLQFWGRRDDDDAEKIERKGMTPRWLEGRDKRRQLFQGKKRQGGREKENDTFREERVEEEEEKVGDALEK